jgi:hypothetical protein
MPSAEKAGCYSKVAPFEFTKATLRVKSVNSLGNAQWRRTLGYGCPQRQRLN